MRRHVGGGFAKMRVQLCNELRHSFKIRQGVVAVCPSAQQSETTDRDRNAHIYHTSFDVNHVCFSSTGRSRRRCRLLFRCLLLAAAPGFCGCLFTCLACRCFRLAGSKSSGLTTYAAVLQTVRAGSEAQLKALPAVRCCLLTDR